METVGPEDVARVVRDGVVHLMNVSYRVRATGAFERSTRCNDIVLVRASNYRGWVMRYEYAATDAPVTCIACIAQGAL